MEKVAQDKIKTTIDDMKTTIEDRNGIVDAEFETIRSSVESVKSALTFEIEQVNVSLVIFDFNCKASLDEKHFEISWAYIFVFKEKLNEELTLAKNEMKSKMDQISTSVEEMKKTQKESTKPVIAFRATCAKNFPPSTFTTYKSENPGTNVF